MTLGKPQLLRFTLPVSTTPTFPTGSKTGVGDLLLMDLVMFPGKSVSLGVGPVVVAPTASSARFGAGKWQLGARSEEHTSELQSLMRISYAVFCLKKKIN